MRKIILSVVAAGTALTALPAAAAAQPGYYGGGYYGNSYDRNRDGYVSRNEARQAQRDQRQYQRQVQRSQRQYQRQVERYGYNGYYGNNYNYGQYYNNRGYYTGPTWRGNDGRYYCRRSDGTAGTLIGGAAGALIGSQVAGRGDRTLGAVLGGVLGAVIGNSVDRDDGGRRCR
jgi:hypothetical protein